MTDADRLDKLRTELRVIRAKIAMNLPRSHTDVRLIQREHDIARQVYLLTRKVTDESGGGKTLDSLK